MIVAGVCIQPDTFTPVIGVTKELSLEFVSFYERPDFAHTLDMLGTERLVASPMITNTVPLTDMPAAFEALKQPTTQCKVIVEP